jgi:aminoglycoside phosphotransferase family enzyme/predicted kinase
MPEPIDRAAFLRALMHAHAYPHPVRTIEHLETHISDVFLTGDYAYKLKKPLNLGFLDFSTLARRRFCCEEELRLNRRLAPELYLAIVPITGTASNSRIGGSGTIIDYAVQMRQFDQAGMLERLAADGKLTAAAVDAIADQVAEFHAGLSPAPLETDYGTAAQIIAPMLQNFEQLQPLVESDAEREALGKLREWAQSRHDELADLFEMRRRGGFVRECHGDLHLGNIVLVDGRVRIFDCIEFNPQLRWIDVVNEAAFLAMDLIQRGYFGLAYRFLNRYLEHTGDYAGVRLLRYYMVYRALVRAKVAAMRAAQSGVEATTQTRLKDKCRAHIELAQRLANDPHPILLIMHGFSGSGKTVLSQIALEVLGAIRVRSDVERKRLHGLAASVRTNSEVGEGIYAPSAGQATYDHLATLTEHILVAGFPALVDATFLKRDQRAQFQSLAAKYEVRVAILDVQASEGTLRRRIAMRAATGMDASEASEAVLERQLASQERLTSEEEVWSHGFDGEYFTRETVAPQLLAITQTNDASYH